MNINQVLNNLDRLFAERQFEQAEEFLKNHYTQAVEEGDKPAQLTLLNELMGYYREGTQFDKAVACARKALAMMKELGLEGTMDYATTLLNTANAYRAAGMYDESLDCYHKVFEIYEGKVEKTDFMYATLYNNLSILYQAVGNYAEAAKSLYSALEIVKLYEDAKIELAVTYTNLGATLVKAGKYNEALSNLKKAEEIFNRDERKDYHYSACMDALGEVYYMLGFYEESAECYETALKEIEDTIGRNKTYDAVRESLNRVYEKLGRTRKSFDEREDKEKEDKITEKKSETIEGNHFECNRTSKKMIDLCQEYYETYGRPMLNRDFSAYVDRITVGLVGEGSQCLGYEDEISGDHDCGPGFCMWMSKETFDEIGDKLNAAYNQLPDTFKGVKRNSTKQGKQRMGAMVTDAFYQSILGVPYIPVQESEWENIEEWRFRTATNGRIFQDTDGLFTEIRERLLAYYPDRVWIKKLAEQLAKCAQSGQYNYGRMMARGEYVTAKIVLAKYMEDVMQLIYLLNRTYAPYYKWIHKGMKNVRHLPEVYDILRAVADMPDQREAWKDYKYDGRINPKDNIALTIEIIAKLIVNQLNEIGLSDCKDLFLQSQAEYMAENIDKILADISSIKDRMERCDSDETVGLQKETYLEKEEGEQERKEQLVNQLVSLEWQAFDKVQNVGGRAECQDDWTTFSIMRKSQYMTWSIEMLESFIIDFEQANAQGRNLITEKYGRMMESTAPSEYEKIKDAFPKLSEKRIKIQEQIILIQVGWMEEFAKNYHYMAQNARIIHTAEDTLYDTSYETYLRGELGTYSERTLILYAQFIVSLAGENRNLAYMIMENTAKCYGFDSLDEAEKYCSE